ncbi:MAG TPA: PKD domain-containing protein, partial [Rudaea sp.]|nr:PKD domain-containing protein [Rudaea sp.]
NALVLSVQPSLKALVQYNTITSEGDCLILAINGDASSSVAIQNNALIGKPDWVKANESPQPQSCLFYWDSGPATWPVTYTGNLVWQTKNNTCPSGTGNRCNADPQLTDASLSSFNATPLPTSPLIDAASTSVPTLATDFLNLPRPALNGYDIGAVEFQSSASGGGTIPNQPPTAVASATITAGVAPLAVSFNGSASSDPDGSIASYAWAFGDGSTASGAATAHTYNAAGTYSAKLTVTDNAGATASQSVTITVSANDTAIIAPSSLSASSGKRGTVTLRWTDNASGAQGIYVERAPVSGGGFVRVGQTSPTATTYTQTGVDAGNYLYRVQAYAATASAYSSSVSVKVK